MSQVPARAFGRGWGCRGGRRWNGGHQRLHCLSLRFTCDAIAIHVEGLVHGVELGVHDEARCLLLAGLHVVCGSGACHTHRLDGDELRTTRVALPHRSLGWHAKTQHESDHADDSESPPHRGDANVFRPIPGRPG